MKRLIFTFLLSLTLMTVYGQIKFQKKLTGTSNSVGQKIISTSDSAFIILGYTDSYGAGDEDVYLIKLNSNGDTLWTRTYGGIYQELGLYIQETSDGGFIITGQTSSFGSGLYDVYLIKTDSVGNLIWSKSYGGTASDRGFSVLQTPDGGYIICGESASVGTGQYSVYVIKTDLTGIVSWTKTYGGLDSESANSLQQTTDGGYIVFGITTSFGVGMFDFYLLKIDSLGNLSWSKSYGGGGVDVGNIVKQTLDGGYILMGYTNSFGSGGLDVLVIKTDSSGNQVWSKVYGGLGGDYTLSIDQVSDEGYILSGTTGSFGAGGYDAYLIRIDSIGDTLWTKTYGENLHEVFYSAKETADGGFIITGTSGTNSKVDLYLVKTDSDGVSGCYEGNVATIVGLAATQVSTPVTMVSSGGNAINAATVVFSGGVLSTLCYTTGDDELSLLNYFKIFPNPIQSGGLLKFDYKPSSQPAIFTLYDLTGRVVFEKPLLAGTEKQEITLPLLQAGLYLAEIRSGNGKSSAKLVVE